MATNPPCYPCCVCGGALEFEMVETRRAPGGFWCGPTDYRQLPHECPPGAAEKWLERIIDRSPREPFFRRIGT